MAKQVIDLGTAPDTETGDNARAWAGKSNSNFTELYDSKTDWKFIASSFVEKGGGNSGAGLEANDRVYFKKITNNGTPMMLIGHTYNGGDDQIRTNYTQEQTIDI